MMTDVIGRRRLLRGAAAISTLALLPGCAAGLPGSGGLAAVLRDLLTLSSQRAFARLLTDDGFLNDDLVRLGLPPELTGSGGLLATLLSTPLVQNQLLALVNDAAGVAADAAVPVIDDTIRSLTFADAAAVLRGGPQAATGVLQRALGNTLADRLAPSALLGLREGQGDILSRVMGAATGYDVNRLAANVGQQASQSIFRAIGREEAYLRANPQETNNPALIAALSVLS